MGMPNLRRKDREDTEYPEKSLYQMQQDSVKMVRVLAKSEANRSLFQQLAKKRLNS